MHSHKLTRVVLHVVTVYRMVFMSVYKRSVMELKEVESQRLPTGYSFSAVFTAQGPQLKFSKTLLKGLTVYRRVKLLI